MAEAQILDNNENIETDQNVLKKKRLASEQFEVDKSHTRSIICYWKILQKYNAQNGQF